METMLTNVKNVVKHPFTIFLAKHLASTAVATFGLLAGFAAFGAVMNRLNRFFTRKSTTQNVNPEVA